MGGLQSHLIVGSFDAKIALLLIFNETSSCEKTIPKFTVDELGEFLSSKFDDDVIESLHANKVSGGTSMKLTEQQIGRMVTAIGDVVELMALQSRVTKMLNPLSEQVSFCHLHVY